jgi:hypothetical protein
VDTRRPRPGLSTGGRYGSAVDQRRRNRALRTRLPSQERLKNGRRGLRWVNFAEQANLRNGNSSVTRVSRQQVASRRHEFLGCAAESIKASQKSRPRRVRCTEDYCSCVVGKCRPPLNHSHARTRCFSWPRRNLQNHIAEGRLDNRDSKAHNGQ